MKINYKSVLKHIEAIELITAKVNLENMQYEIPETGGVYTFWYNNKDRSLKSLKRSFLIKGPNEVEQWVEWDWNLNNEYVCLYIGKSTNLRDRISKHLLLKTNHLYLEQSDWINKKTSSCQLRAGFDYLFQNSGISDMRQKVSEKIYLSFVEIKDFRERFYIEDYLIGHFLPWFNIDSER